MRALKTSRRIGPTTRWPSLPSSGLSQLPAYDPKAGATAPGAPTAGGDKDPWWLRLSLPFAEATAHRIAHGQTPRFGFDYSQSYMGPQGQYGGFPTGASQLSQYIPLMGIGLVALMLLRK